MILHQPGWQRDPCGCFQEQSDQLAAAARPGSPIALGSQRPCSPWGIKPTRVRSSCPMNCSSTTSLPSEKNGWQTWKVKVVLEERAKERYEAEQADDEAKLREREETAHQPHRKPKGRDPKPPEPGSRDKDRYNFTDPESRILKNSNDDGFDQHYNVQAAVE